VAINKEEATMPEVINQDGQQLIWIAKYMRYHQPDEAECESLEEAIHFLRHGEEYGYLSEVGIVGPDGQAVDASWY
jgi:glycine cleavage system H lipoate-binding protein